MQVTDGMINGILKEMGVEPNKPARWKKHIHKFIDQRTGEVFQTREDGYFCSKCGKYSYYNKSVCDGCGSQMPKESEVAERREVSENNTVRCFHPSVTESQREAERREDIEKSPADCSTPSVTDQKGEGNEQEICAN